MSQVSVLSKWVDGSSWFFWHVAFFRPTLLCSIRKFTYLQKLGVLPSGTLSQTPDIEKFCFGVSIVETCYQFSSRKMDAHSVINWTQNGYSTQEFGNLQLRLCAVPPLPSRSSPYSSLGGVGVSRGVVVLKRGANAVSANILEP